jgi:aryl-alcohol dehydrogenase-like predicted oxidoreductase
MLAIYNAIHRGIEPELIPVCRRFGIQIVTYNPLAGSPNNQRCFDVRRLLLWQVQTEQGR